MTIAFEAPGVVLYQGDCIDVMRTLPDASVDAVVTDPPYGLEFMGREWDGADGFRRSLDDAGHPIVLGQIAAGEKSTLGPLAAGKGTHSRGFADHDANAFQAWCQVWAAEALRILKPGGHMVAFGGARTWHRLAVAIEDAGFEIRDSIAWLYGSGFPKSMDVPKAITATQRHGGASSTKLRQSLMGDEYAPSDRIGNRDGARRANTGAEGREVELTPDAEDWLGWGTALKPAFEPIVVGRKPLGSTVAKTVLEHGTGALNIDATRTPYADDADRKEATDKNQHAKFGTESGQNNVYGDYSMVPAKDFDSTKGRWPTNVVLDESQREALGRHGRLFPTFRYEAKAGSAERPTVDGIQHPTVKPLELMRWLIRLTTPRGGNVLEPFAGSGTTVEAALLEGVDVIGIEREPSYIPLTIKRLSKPLQQSMFGDWDEDAA